MITRDEFPYLQKLLINDAYAVKDRRVTVFEPGQGFKHLVLTGRNGSGKTTVLREMHNILKGHAGAYHKNSAVDPYARITAHFIENEQNPFAHFLPIHGASTVALFFEAGRRVQVQEVLMPVREDQILDKVLNIQYNASSSELFKQYLVNKKITQTFDLIDNKVDDAIKHQSFFINLEFHLSNIFSDPLLKLEFVRESFEFYINLSDGRRFTFNQLSAGYSAFLSILTELLMRTDLLRKKANDYTYDPCGFVLIDEPETHLHLEMQYQILPLLTNLFPNLQFIVATHSPAVASSIKNATVYDLSTGETLGDSAAGSSFSELMQTHFGLENEYSNVADAILDEVAEIIALPDQAAARARLQKLLDEQGRYMSPVLRLDVQAQLLSLQNDQAA